MLQIPYFYLTFFVIFHFSLHNMIPLNAAKRPFCFGKFFLPNLTVFLPVRPVILEQFCPATSRFHRNDGIWLFWRSYPVNTKCLGMDNFWLIFFNLLLCQQDSDIYCEIQHVAFDWLSCLKKARNLLLFIWIILKDRWEALTLFRGRC